MEKVVAEIPASVPKEKREKVLASLHTNESLGEDVPFPSMVISANSIVPQGKFAQKQASYLSPPEAEVEALCAELRRRRVGVVAHYYMDAEVQGLLTACAARFAADASLNGRQPVFIADSLAMGDAALRMAQGEGGVRAIVCMGVDFMSENCRAVLSAAGRADVPVYRTVSQPIGCSLAQAADAPAYLQWLEREAEQARADGLRPVHVVYINTSLAAKAHADAAVPTVSCTSSNVVRTILQVALQVGPERACVLYGPDAYMGRNLRSLFARIAGAADDGPARAAHPGHTRATVAAVLRNMRTYDAGYCLVHHLFGADVARRARELYVARGALPTAHLEVPGEMFELALEAQSRGEGVVGATSDILSFIGRTVDARLKQMTASSARSRVQVLLGTESGMATSVVRKVQEALRARPEAPLEVELVFPVSSQAIAPTGERDVPVVPGVCQGEGCGAAGGCASCPFMKMNTLAALRSVVSRVGEPGEAEALAPMHPRQYAETIAGRSVAELGAAPILVMRAFQKSGSFPQSFTDDVLTRGVSK